MLAAVAIREFSPVRAMPALSGERLDGWHVGIGDGEEQLEAGPARRHFGIGGKSIYDFLRPRLDGAGVRVAASVQIDSGERDVA